MFGIDDTHIRVQNINTQRYSKMRAVDFRPYYRHSDPCTTVNAVFKAQGNTSRTQNTKPAPHKKQHTRKRKTKATPKNQGHNRASQNIETGKSVSRRQKMGSSPRRRAGSTRRHARHRLEKSDAQQQKARNNSHHHDIPVQARPGQKRNHAQSQVLDPRRTHVTPYPL